MQVRLLPGILPFVEKCFFTKVPMKVSKRVRDRLQASCGELQEDDCLDPRLYFDRRRQEGSGRATGRKSQQLCRQVAQTLDLVLGDSHQAELQSLRVESVVPAPDSTRLLVTLSCDLVGAEVYSRETLLALLNSQAGRLRCEVANAITRKKAPALIFEVTLPGN